MINDNTLVKEERDKGTKCVGLKRKLKRDCIVNYKDWDGKLIHSVSCLNVRYVLCDTIWEKDNETPKKFRLKTARDAITIEIFFWKYDS